MIMKVCIDSPAKCIISGEHSVVRGGGALVMPLNNFTLHAEYTASNVPLCCVASGVEPDLIKGLFSRLVHAGLTSLGQPLNALCGEITIHNDIPIGKGLGFSAAFCSVISRLFIIKGLLDDKQFFSFAHQLEHKFHGKSSGVDIAGVSSDQAVFYKNANDYISLHFTFKPQFSLYYLGRPSSTIASVKKVALFCEQKCTEGAQIDQDMLDSVHRAMSALTEPYDNHSIDNLSKALQLAQSCYERWGLISIEDKKKIAYLYRQGAAAVKVTGAGNGGYLLVLWAQYPLHTIEGLYNLS